MKIKFVILLTALTVYCIAQNTNNLSTNTMKKAFLGLRTVGIYVEDLDSAKNWYSKAFDTQPYFDEPFYVGFNIGGYELGLMPKEENISESKGNIVVYWGVNDIQTTFDALIQIGAKPKGNPKNVGGPIVVAMLEDPWGNILGLIYNPEFKIEQKE